ncbi:MAG: PorT family protein [Microscillaceae bacterium]|nr:PorT family protein [Microscillaceae bacterium]MDW8461482.1 hypothetical protein [Cytophagales bacterium]
MNKEEYHILTFEQVIQDKLSQIQPPFEPEAWGALEAKLFALAQEIENAQKGIDNLFAEKLAQLSPEYEPSAWEAFEQKLALENAELDAFFAEKLAQLAPEYEPSAWQALEAKLFETTTEKPIFSTIIPLWRWAAAACLLLVGSWLLANLANWLPKTANNYAQTNQQKNTIQLNKQYQQKQAIIPPLPQETLANQKKPKANDKIKANISLIEESDLQVVSQTSDNNSKGRATIPTNIKITEKNDFIINNSTDIALTKYNQEVQNSQIAQNNLLTSFGQALQQHSDKNKTDESNQQTHITLNPMAERYILETLQMQGSIGNTNKSQAMHYTEHLPHIQKPEPLRRRFAPSFKVGLLGAWEANLIKNKDYKYVHYVAGGLMPEVRILPKIAIATGAIFKYIDYKLSELTSLEKIKNKIEEPYSEALRINYITQPDAPEILLYNHVNTFAIDIPLEIKYVSRQNKKTEWFVSAGTVASVYIYQTFSKDLRKANTHTRLFLDVKDAEKPNFYWGGFQVSAGIEHQLSKNLYLTVNPYLRIPYTRMGIEDVYSYTLGLRTFFSIGW